LGRFLIFSTQLLAPPVDIPSRLHLLINFPPQVDLLGHCQLCITNGMQSLGFFSPLSSNQICVSWIFVAVSLHVCMGRASLSRVFVMDVHVVHTSSARVILFSQKRKQQHMQTNTRTQLSDVFVWFAIACDARPFFFCFGLVTSRVCFFCLSLC
jgi:hypothetical protein